MKFFKKSFLSSINLQDTWFSLSKNLNFKEIVPGSVLKVNYLTVSDNGVLKKTFVGLCLGKRQKNTKSSFTIRNFIKTDSVEMTFFFNSPGLLSVEVLQNYKKKFKFSKLYFLRNFKRKSLK